MLEKGIVLQIKSVGFRPTSAGMTLLTLMAGSEENSEFCFPPLIRGPVIT